MADRLQLKCLLSWDVYSSGVITSRSEYYFFQILVNISDPSWVLTPRLPIMVVNVAMVRDARCMEGAHYRNEEMGGRRHREGDKFNMGFSQTSAYRQALQLIRQQDFNTAIGWHPNVGLVSLFLLALLPSNPTS